MTLRWVAQPKLAEQNEFCLLVCSCPVESKLATAQTDELCSDRAASRKVRHSYRVRYTIKWCGVDKQLNTW